MGAGARQGEKKILHNLYGQVLSAPPGKGRSQFFEEFLLGWVDWMVGVVNLAFLA